MDCKIEVKCRKCGQVSYILSKGGRDEVITFVCPNCGKHELLVAYDLNVGHTDDKQKYVFVKAIEENYVKECQRCGCDIPWCEMLEALDNGGFCGYLPAYDGED